MSHSRCMSVFSFHFFQSSSMSICSVHGILDLYPFFHSSLHLWRNLPAFPVIWENRYYLEFIYSFLFLTYLSIHTLLRLCKASFAILMHLEFLLHIFHRPLTRLHFCISAWFGYRFWLFPLMMTLHWVFLNVLLFSRFN